jgi:hypothetical protein
MISQKLKQSIIGMQGYLKESNTREFLVKYINMKKKKIGKAGNEELLQELKANLNDAVDFIDSQKNYAPRTNWRKYRSIEARNIRLPLNVPVIFIKNAEGIVVMHLAEDIKL